MLRPVRRFFAIFVVTAKRLIHQRGLALALSLGLLTAVALMMSIPIYADATHQHILRDRVTGAEGDAGDLRPPFALMFRYIGSWSGAVDWTVIEPVDNYFSGQAIADLGLPGKMHVRFFATDTFQIFPPAENASYVNVAKTLAYLKFASLSDFAEHITLLEGSLPAEDGDMLDVLIQRSLADKLGLQVGEEYKAFRAYLGNSALNTELMVRVAGIWEAADPADPYWFYAASTYTELMIVPLGRLTGSILPAMPEDDRLNLGVWYLVLDDTRVQSSEVDALIGRISQVELTARGLLPKLRLDISPVKVLQAFKDAAQSLMVFLYAVSVPVLAMTLVFIILVGEMAVSQRRNEIAVLRSRGATLMQVVGMAALEGLLLAAVGLAVGAPTAQMVAQFFGRARSFLDFSGQSNFQPILTTPALQVGLAAAAVALLAQTLPAIGAGRHTIVTYKQERARQLRPPWWQRAWLDVLLLIPAAYGAYQLSQQGMTGLVNDPFQNPLILLVPALGILALTLFILRILPWLMRLIAWLASFTRSVGVLMATRQLSRSAAVYTAPLVLIIFTLSLSTFTATLAQTLDRHLRDQTYYQVGSDISIYELGSEQLKEGAAPATGQPALEDLRWVFLPVEEHRQVPGVEAAARVARTPVSLLLEGGALQAEYIGVDRVDFSQTAFWRRDFASQPLGALMNNLALTSEGVLINSSLATTYRLKIGDAITVLAYPFGERKQISMTVVGTFDYFPTWYPDKGPLVVGNLDYLFEQVGGEFPYSVWLRTQPAEDYHAVIAGVREIYLRLLNPGVALAAIETEQARPERQGLFGLLSVGFTAVAFLTVLGFFLYALFSFRRRFIELGMLRAVGLSAGQMMVFLTAELALLLVIGLGAGTGLGVAISNLFIPTLQVGAAQTAQVPPFLVQIDWTAVFQIYILFGLLFVAALIVLGILLLRMKIFQAVKLGEAG